MSTACFINVHMMLKNIVTSKNITTSWYKIISSSSLKYKVIYPFYQNAIYHT